MNVLLIIIRLFIGLGLFLYGMRQMSNALKALAGGINLKKRCRRQSLLRIKGL